jgi:hypothetical protein
MIDEVYLNSVRCNFTSLDPDQGPGSKANQFMIIHFNLLCFPCPKKLTVVFHQCVKVIPPIILSKKSGKICMYDEVIDCLLTYYM